MHIAKNLVVSINFKLTDHQGTVLDASDEGTPLIYLHGAAGIVPGLEAELEGKAVGETFNVTVTPVEGFGEINPELIQKIPVTSFPDPSLLQPGMQVEGRTEESGQVTHFIIREITDEAVTLDSNHPLAGLTLCFEGDVAEIRQGTDEEINLGQPL
ncbi:MAG: peptidylprolyl isomerase [Gammaproteobacteria bacterium]|jgi:FKBP-type peptidyl-prolyl cis-trans isomerase SlyD|nr:peptidylprolyl isomerase [Chromatiales bacterium]MCP4925983.1 peptidylprolyl isomerase [Gammaproteobacteria bacterium]MDP6094829.1 peptidylprolyl isomerase [Gammaproteobacteria bacterium]